MGRILSVIVFGVGLLYGSTYTVSSLTDAGTGSLRQAITDANSHAGADTITFTTAGTIGLASALPAITDTVVISAESQFLDDPGDTLDGGNLVTVGLELNGVSPNKAHHCAIRGLYIKNFTQKAVYLNQSNNTTIGGTALMQKNVISDNRNVGIYLQSCVGTKIIGNAIGTDVDGTLAVSNAFGIVIAASTGNTIGGSAISEKNIIAGNTADGIQITDITSSDNVIKGNAIGTNTNGVVDLGNGQYGIYLENGARHTLIGGSGPKDGNTIAFNGKGVVVVDDNTDYNTISRNSIFSNDGLGIDLGNDGVGVQSGSGTPNEAINFPVITRAEPDTVWGTAPALSTVEIFKAAPDPSTYGEGKQFAGSGLAAGTGNFAIAVTGLAAGDTATATATDGQGNTSEFSHNKRVDRYQPDNWIATKLTPTDDYIGNDTINTDGKNQTKSLKIAPHDSALYYIKIQNDGSASDSFKVTGTAGSGNWTVSYYDSTAAGTNITTAITGSGWFTKPLAPTLTKEIRLLVKAGAVTAPDTLEEVLVTSASTVDTAKKDAVKAATTIEILQPDNLIATKLDGSDYLGDGIYNTDGSQQTQTLGATTTSPAIYYIKIENDGNFKDQFTVKGDSGSATWQATYYSDTTGGTDITGAIAAGTYQTDSLDTAGVKKIRLEVKPKTGAPPSDTTKDIIVLSVSVTDTSKKDAVKAATTTTAVNETPAHPLRFALLPPKPNPARHFVDINFTVPVRASVRLEIYDAGGRTVRTLFDQTDMSPGRYRRTWDGRDNFHAPLPAGVYFVGMETKNYRETKKLILFQ